MDPHTYQRWWVLHLRAARSENLTAEERALYEAGLKQLQQEEVREGHRAGIRNLRDTVAALQSEHAQLDARRQKLDAEIMALEATLDERTRQLLGVED